MFNQSASRFRVVQGSAQGLKAVQNEGCARGCHKRSVRLCGISMRGAVPPPLQGCKLGNQDAEKSNAPGEPF